MCTTQHDFARVSFGCCVSLASFAVPSSNFVYGDALCTGDREQQLHGDGRKMEPPLAFSMAGLFSSCLYRGMAHI